ncbi:class I SAM-dependent methyltransferase [Leucobacter allii]|uniref:class I SAM-dependent methyltransferase n=1 Tax=Leucobacter allii TaxID=2932247 RepID=UPI001FD5D75C|nr:class I SAM-dependent methyltransferase [Leucobacter allii]UOR00753.1 class I SAM-dependent methyltransferase [Leucobacter allii]
MAERNDRGSADLDAATARTAGAYGARADEYIAAVGRIGHVAEPDLVLVREWALGIAGPLLDVGCGPGQWTRYLAELGADARGVDPSPEFLARARSDAPGVRFRLGAAERLGARDASIGGVLAWYSLIHTPPEHIAAPLTEFARVLRRGGGLALGFFAGSELAPFDHAVATAYFWPPQLLTAELAAAGFTVARVETRHDPGARPHGAILAVRDG